MRFIGDYPAKTDAKGRVFLPVAFRKVLDAEEEKNLVLRNDVFQKCLVLYPESVWNAQLDSLRSQVNQWNSRQQMALRRFEADAEPIELDKNGRLLISKRKLQYAGIEGDVRFLAMVDRIEIWSKAALEEVMNSSVDLGSEMEAMFGQPDGMQP
ncbi:MAG: division/cell wall cluster transcriptional repressor MraZ [Bacteroidaceae bacterium]|nr:division/cell wall cluster transcriptional repressor MraZ [Bacteroidaceae bacterium]